MKDRIIQFLAAEKISPAEFADKIGVQRSSMSHILNGRNYPSAAFLQKMLQAYPDMNPRWLMIGNGTMNMELADVGKIAVLPDFRHEEPVNQTQTVLLQDHEAENPIVSAPETVHVSSNPGPVIPLPGSDTGHSSESILNQSISAKQTQAETPEPSNGKEIEQVLFFYMDKTFRIYRPS